MPLLFSFQLVDLNQASLEQLMALDGVGQKMAERIVDHRNEKGGFASLEDLLLVQGMKPKLFEKVRKKIIIGRRNKAKLNSLMTDEQVEGLLAEYTKEPAVQEVYEHALKYANAHPDQMRSWLARARMAYWLPKFSTGLDPNWDRHQTLREKLGDSNLLTSKKTTDWRFHVKAEWQFNHLIFNREELSIGREFLRQSLMRERILNRIQEAYFERRRLQIQKQLKNALDNASKIENALRLEQLTAELDGLTGGWFSQRVD